VFIAAISSVAQAQWQQMPGRGSEIGAGSRGDVWVLGADRVEGGHAIHRWRGSDWERVEGGAVRPDVDPQGRPRVVNSAVDILRLDRRGWQRMPGRAMAISAGQEPWLVDAGSGIYRWDPRR
jgi:hypothetical protein